MIKFLKLSIIILFIGILQVYINGVYAEGNIQSGDSMRIPSSYTEEGIKKIYLSNLKKLEIEYKWKIGTKKLKDNYLTKKKELFKKYELDLQNFKYKKDKKIKNVNNKKDNTKKRYKRIYHKKYGRMIMRLNNSKLEIFIGKIDKLLVKINSNKKYPDKIKEKYNTILYSLREIAKSALFNKKIN